MKNGKVSVLHSNWQMSVLIHLDKLHRYNVLIIITEKVHKEIHSSTMDH